MAFIAVREYGRPVLVQQLRRFDIGITFRQSWVVAVPAFLLPAPLPVTRRRGAPIRAM
jgi:hypothetical protein